jgi:hypothetical protein
VRRECHAADRKRQKKLEKSRKKRDLVKKQARKREAQYQGTSLLRLAQSAPFGPAWVSASLDEPDTDQSPPYASHAEANRDRERWQLAAVLASSNMAEFTRPDLGRIEARRPVAERCR